MTTVEAASSPAGTAPLPRFGEAFKVWVKIGCINFGGPAGQIALMHRILVDEKKWIDEPRFLHALELLHAAARAGGAAACDLCRLADAWLARRARRRRVVRAARRVGDARPELSLCARARPAAGRGRALRHQGRGAGDRGRGHHPHRQARPENEAADRPRGSGLRRHLCFVGAVSADRDRRRRHRLCGGAHRSRTAGLDAGRRHGGSAAARALARGAADRRDLAARSGGCRSLLPRSRSDRRTSWSRSACSSQNLRSSASAAPMRCLPTWRRRWWTRTAGCNPAKWSTRSASPKRRQGRSFWSRSS